MLESSSEMGSHERPLSSVFQTPPDVKVGTYGGLIHEMTEMVALSLGQYARGNQPIQHMVYLYNCIGQPWKTQAMVRRIMDEMYDDQPDGLAGNEDCGQMSAWYIFSSLGFYPVCPGSGHYAVGSPLFRKATIHLGNGKTFTIQTAGNTDENVFIKEARLNGEGHTRSYLTHEDIMKGGLLQLTMDSRPNKDWGSAPGEVPKTSIDHLGGK